MRGIRRWLTSAALLSGSAAWAQSPALPPVPADEPPIATALPGGTVVSGGRPASQPAAPVTLLPIADTPPTAGAPPVPGPGMPAAGAPIVAPPPPTVKPGGPMFVTDSPLVTPVATNALYGGCANGDCCRPIGAHGPIGNEIYFRTGVSLPFGSSRLAHKLDYGWATTGGGRAEYFDVGGGAAWAIDAHAFYTYNNSSSQEVSTFRGEPVTPRALHRSGVGLGIGRDYFMGGPGFVGGMWDANLRWGWDAGARWGAGHADLNLITNEAIYRRHYDVFGQPFAGLHATLEIPMGGWTGIAGGRLEYSYTFSDILPRGGNVQDVVIQLQLGVRY